jgi:Tol biopolymer transport system component
VGFIGRDVSIWILDLVTSKTRMLVTRSSDPAFSPNRRWIAFASTRDRNGTRQVGEDSTAFATDLYLVTPAGTHSRRLTHTHDVSETYPSFSPDSQRVAYQLTNDLTTPQSHDSYHQSVREINLDGSCSTATETTEPTSSDSPRRRGALAKPRCRSHPMPLSHRQADAANRVSAPHSVPVTAAS